MLLLTFLYIAAAIYISKIILNEIFYFSGETTSGASATTTTMPTTTTTGATLTSITTTPTTTTISAAATGAYLFHHSHCTDVMIVRNLTAGFHMNTQETFMQFEIVCL